MIKAFFWVALGAAGALQGEKLLGGLREKFTPRAVTDGFLDRLNRRLESKSSGPGTGF
jgi:hypothetical protein